MEDLQAVRVRILDKEYQIACQPDERASLLEAAEYLDRRMRELRGRGSVIGSDRLAVITALNLSNELLRLRGVESEHAALGERLAELQQRVASALDD